MAEPSEDPPNEADFEEPSSPKKVHKKKTRDSSSLRKAPQAPKRFKSSYICFFMAKQPEIKEELGDKATVAEVSKRSAEMWRNIPAEERAHWDEVAAKDKQRYMVEKATYTGPWQVPWKRAKKDPTAPKRPMSAFLYFSQQKRRQIKAENPSLRNTEVSRKLGEMWRNASDEERAPHIEKEKIEREKYKVRIAEWREEFGKKQEEQRKAQMEQAAHAASMASLYSANTQESAQSNEPAQYNYRAPVSAGGYDPNMMSPQPYQQQQQYMGQQQQPPMYGYQQQHPSGSYPPPPPYGQMPYGYPNPNAQGYFNGRQVMVLGPNGMPHFQAPYPNQGDQGQDYDSSSQQYDYGDQGVQRNE